MVPQPDRFDPKAVGVSQPVDDPAVEQEAGGDLPTLMHAELGAEVGVGAAASDAGEIDGGVKGRPGSMPAYDAPSEPVEADSVRNGVHTLGVAAAIAVLGSLAWLMVAWTTHREFSLLLFVIGAAVAAGVRAISDRHGYAEGLVAGAATAGSVLLAKVLVVVFVLPAAVCGF